MRVERDYSVRNPLLAGLFMTFQPALDSQEWNSRQSRAPRRPWFGEFVLTIQRSTRGWRTKASAVIGNEADLSGVV